MAFAVRVTEDYVGVMGRHVMEGQSIVPGSPLLDIMTPDGLVETIFSEGWGIVGHIEGSRIVKIAGSSRAHDDSEDVDDHGESGQIRGSSGGSSAVFPNGTLLCHIVARSHEGSARKNGLHPRSAASVRIRREFGMLTR